MPTPFAVTLAPLRKKFQVFFQVRRIAFRRAARGNEFVQRDRLRFSLDANEIEFAENEKRIFHGRVGRIAQENVRGIFLVQSFESRRKIHGIAQRRVSVPQARAHVAHRRDARAKPHADVEHGPAFGFPFFLHFLEARDHVERRMATIGRVVPVFKRRAPECHHRIADILIERTVVAEDDPRHVRQIFVEQRGKFLRVQFFRNAGEPAHVAEHHGDFRLARLQ